MNKEVTVSVVIPSWNRKDDLHACLSSLRLQQGVVVEIVVTDDDSADGSVQMVKDQFPEVMVLAGEENVGPAHRRNQGVLSTHGVYILQLDSDVRFDNPFAILRMVEALVDRPGVSCVGGEIAAHDADFDHVYALKFDRMMRAQRVSSNSGGELECDYLATLCCMMRRKDVMDIGGHDPYYEYGWDDADIGYRLKCQGFRNIARFDCAAQHFASRSGRHKDSSYRFGVAWWRFVIKHRGVPTFGLWLTWYLLRFGLEAVLLPLARISRAVKAERVDNLRALAYAGIFSLSRLSDIVRCRRVNFLDPEEMRRFEEWKARRKKSNRERCDERGRGEVQGA